jgi:hypothetical protein
MRNLSINAPSGGEKSTDLPRDWAYRCLLLLDSWLEGVPPMSIIARERTLFVLRLGAASVDEAMRLQESAGEGRRPVWWT